MIKSIAVNLSKSTALTELTICGIHFSTSTAELLNSGLLKSASLKKLRLNFCLSRPELLVKLMPALSNPTKVPLSDLNLAANGLTDIESGELISKILIHHCEHRDEIFWKYGLRNEVPPHDQVVGIKRLDLSFNKLGDRAAYSLGMALKTDRYLLALNLRSNQIENEHALGMIQCLNDNRSLFNLDLRDNIGVQQKVYRKLALKLLSSYTKVGQATPQHIWEHEQRYFDSDLLVVQIP